MPRDPTGNAYQSRGRWYARVTLGRKQRPSFALAATDKPTADARAAVLAEIAAKLRKAGKIDQAPRFLKRAAVAIEEDIATILRVVVSVCKGLRAPKEEGIAAATYGQIAERWTSGELARAYPDRVPIKATVRHDRSYLNNHILPLLRDVPIDALTLDDAEQVMSGLPAHLSKGMRRNIAQCLRRVVQLAVYPLRLIPAMPLPRGFLPDKGPPKAKSYLYPDEDARLLGCTAVDLCWRVLFGFLTREGLRVSEAWHLVWSDLDLERGAIKLDRNKTSDPRAWALSAGVVRALLVWRQMREARGGRAAVAPDAAVFVGATGVAIHEHANLSRRLRDILEVAEVQRAELFERSAERRPLRAHDTRATFITIALANGRTEMWVADRTGHRSSAMINLYRRAARSVADLGLGDLKPLDVAIPEIAALTPKGGGKGAGDRAPMRKTMEARLCMDAAGVSR